jgi:hypothetical protein
MEPVLIGVTLFSLVLATGLAIVAWRLLRHERSRSDVRVEELAALAASDEPEIDVDDAIAAEPELVRTEPVHVLLDPRPVVEVREERAVPVPMRFAALDDPDEDPAVPSWDAAAATQPAAEPMFHATVAPRSNGRRWIGLAAAVLMMTGVGVMAYALRSSALAATIVSDAPAAPVEAKPLQLLSLRHATDEAGFFTVTGLVEDPPGNRPMSGVIAVVYLFDQQGNYLAGGHSSLELATLQPGEQSPFVVKVATTAGVARYRVGFRHDSGAVVAHVDRRASSGATGASPKPEAGS